MTTTTMKRIASTFADIREMSPEMPLAALVVFLKITADLESELSEKEPPMIKQIAESLGMPYNTVVRQLLFLSKVKEPGVEGLGWIDTKEWPLDRRQKYVVLTEKGKRLVERIKDSLGAKL